MTKTAKQQDTEEAIRQAYAEQENLQRIDDLRQVLATPEGKRYMWWLLGRTHMYSSTFTGNSNGFFLEGERKIGLVLFRDVTEVEPRLMGDMAESHTKKMAEILSRVEKEAK